MQHVNFIFARFSQDNTYFHLVEQSNLSQTQTGKITKNSTLLPCSKSLDKKNKNKTEIIK